MNNLKQKLWIKTTLFLKSNSNQQRIGSRLNNMIVTLMKKMNQSKTLNYQVFLKTTISLTTKINKSIVWILKIIKSLKIIYPITAKSNLQ